MWQCKNELVIYDPVNPVTQTLGFASINKLLEIKNADGWRLMNVLQVPDSPKILLFFEKDVYEKSTGSGLNKNGGDEN
jgi:hypothetical protein